MIPSQKDDEIRSWPNLAHEFDWRSTRTDREIMEPRNASGKGLIELVVCGNLEASARE
jgi:hypothetical protein